MLEYSRTLLGHLTETLEASLILDAAFISGHIDVGSPETTGGFSV